MKDTIPNTLRKLAKEIEENPDPIKNTVVLIEGRIFVLSLETDVAAIDKAVVYLHEALLNLIDERQTMVNKETDMTEALAYAMQQLNNGETLQ